jgi:hypothetical protein
MTTANVAVTAVNPSINVAALGVPTTVVVPDTTPAVPVVDLRVLETARISWETTELAASNNRLYGILQQAYQFYLVMKQDESKDVRLAKKAALEAFIEERGYANSFGATTHDMTRVVKCVFGVDRRRVSAYSIALREALRQEVEAADLVVFLQENGGVEQIRMGGTKPLSTTKRAELVMAEVSQAVISTVKFDAAAVKASTDWIDQQVVFVATYLPTGEFEVNAVVKHDGAVKTALAAYYTLAKAKEREELHARKKADAKALAELKEQEKAEAKVQEKVAKQKAKVAEAIAEQERITKADVAFDALFTTQVDKQAEFA